MSRYGADQISGDPALQARFLGSARAAEMNAERRDELIVRLHIKGWNHTKIGHAVGLSWRGVGMALQRIAECRSGRVRAD